METNNDSRIPYSEVTPLLLLLFISSSVTFLESAKPKQTKLCGMCIVSCLGGEFIFC